MTTITNPAASSIRPKDVVTVAHSSIVGSFGVVVGDDGKLTLPGVGGFTPVEAARAGYTFPSLERPVEAKRDELTLTGTVDSGFLTVELTLPSGAKRTLFSGRVTGYGRNTQSVKINKSDFEG